MSYDVTTHRKEHPCRISGIVVFGPGPYVTKPQIENAAAEVTASGRGVWNLHGLDSWWCVFDGMKHYSHIRKFISFFKVKVEPYSYSTSFQFNFIFK
jgi:hypothetical protein